MDIVHAHVPRVGVVRGKDNLGNGRCCVGGDCVVEGVLRT
jgi:hypothetical protein